MSVIDGRTLPRRPDVGLLPAADVPAADDYPTASLALAPSVRTAYVASSAKGTVSLVPMLR